MTNCTEADCDFADHPNHRHVTRDTVVLDSGRVAYERKPETIAAFLRNLPEAFVDPLEQLERGRLADPVVFAEMLVGPLPLWQQRMLRNGMAVAHSLIAEDTALEKRKLRRVRRGSW